MRNFSIPYKQFKHSQRRRLDSLYDYSSDFDNNDELQYTDSDIGKVRWTNVSTTNNQNESSAESFEESLTRSTCFPTRNNRSHYNHFPRGVDCCELPSMYSRKRRKPSFPQRRKQTHYGVNFSPDSFYQCNRHKNYNNMGRDDSAYWRKRKSYG